jgi:hypothetical protein
MLTKQLRELERQDSVVTYKTPEFITIKKKSMTLHEKARAYAELMQDVEEFLAAVESHYNDVEKVGADQEGKEDSTFYAKKVGTLIGSNFGLGMKISRFKGTLRWYKELK